MSRIYIPSEVDGVEITKEQVEQQTVQIANTLTNFLAYNEFTDDLYDVFINDQYAIKISSRYLFYYLIDSLYNITKVEGNTYYKICAPRLAESQENSRIKIIYYIPCAFYEYYLSSQYKEIYRLIAEFTQREE